MNGLVHLRQLFHGGGHIDLAPEPATREALAQDPAAAIAAMLWRNGLPPRPRRDYWYVAVDEHGAVVATEDDIEHGSARLATAATVRP